jgi:hypothetical protein
MPRPTSAQRVGFVQRRCPRTTSLSASASHGDREEIAVDQVGHGFVSGHESNLSIVPARAFHSRARPRRTSFPAALRR